MNQNSTVTSASEVNYPIGRPGTPWGAQEKLQWKAAQTVKRDYREWVLTPLQRIATRAEVEQYGALPYDPDRYPLYSVKSHDWHSDKPNVLITGGVHGYETSGVMGALAFAETRLQDYSQSFNLLVLPCVSPWGFETINRWNPDAVDPNRSFVDNSPSPEAAQVLALLAREGHEFLAHIDLHETTDTDNSEFRPALAARDGVFHEQWEIPDGFYLVGDTAQPQADFQRAIVQGVEAVTHIAPADENDKLIGVPIEQHGVINYDKKALGLCGGCSGAPYVTTTEVYPDSPLVDDQNCIDAQVAAICAGLDYLLSSAD